jgi:hypothetical protein
MLNLLRAGALALVCAALSGCANPFTSPTGTAVIGSKPSITLTGDPFVDFNPVMTRLAVFTEADVQAALADAKLQKDAVGELCWQVVLDNFPVIAPPAQAQAEGAASAIQRGRDLRAAIPKVADACAAILPTGLAALGGATGL